MAGALIAVDPARQRSPAAPETGRLYFQFSVDIDFQCLIPGAEIRGVDAFITLHSGSYLDIRWPLQVVPQFTALEQSARADITGSIPVTAGEQINLDFTYRMVLFAGGGELNRKAGSRRTARYPINKSPLPTIGRPINSCCRFELRRRGRRREPAQGRAGGGDDGDRRDAEQAAADQRGDAGGGVGDEAGA
jgi:hypothetical protein